jgi:hypothetical protein
MKNASMVEQYYPRTKYNIHASDLLYEEKADPVRIQIFIQKGLRVSVRRGLRDVGFDDKFIVSLSLS